MNNAAVLWTGGKDCALAFLKAQKAGYNITHLVTFSPEKPSFKAHALSLIKQQVKTIDLPHLILTVGKPHKETYENAIKLLKDNYAIETLITGDIDEIEGHDNWIENRSKKSGMKVFNPLWKKERAYLLNELMLHNFEVLFTLVKKDKLDKHWVGRTLTKNTINELSKIQQVDLCGENGEYHTMVINAPFFKNKIEVSEYDIVDFKNYYYLKLR